MVCAVQTTSAVLRLSINQNVTDRTISESNYFQADEVVDLISDWQTAIVSDQFIIAYVFRINFLSLFSTQPSSSKTRKRKPQR